jgi:hypothetical protein
LLPNSYHRERRAAHLLYERERRTDPAVAAQVAASTAASNARVSAARAEERQQVEKVEKRDPPITELEIVASLAAVNSRLDALKSRTPAISEIYVGITSSSQNYRRPKAKPLKKGWLHQEFEENGFSYTNSSSENVRTMEKRFTDHVATRLPEIPLRNEYAGGNGPLVLTDQSFHVYIVAREEREER